MIEEIRNAPDDTLGFMEAASEVRIDNPYVINVGTDLLIRACKSNIPWEKVPTSTPITFRLFVEL